MSQTNSGNNNSGNNNTFNNTVNNTGGGGGSPNWVAIFVALIGAAAVIAAAWISLQKDDPVTTKIAHTYSVKQKKTLGVYLYPSPDRPDKAQRGPGEGQKVTLNCWTTGRDLVDDDYETGTAHSDLWLQIEDGRYLSSLYVEYTETRIKELLDAC